MTPVFSTPEDTTARLLAEGKVLTAVAESLDKSQK